MSSDEGVYEETKSLDVVREVQMISGVSEVVLSAK